MTACQRQVRAVIIVSGGAAVSPFTTPDKACAVGLDAGNTDTYLRAGLLAAGYAVFTSPARVGAGEVTEDPGWAGFSECPIVLPAEMTVNAVGDIDEAGRSLARFITYVHDEFGITEFDLVAHSMGGLFSRAAIRALTDSGSSARVRTLTTVGTPWQGGFAADYAAGDVPLADCNGDPNCERSMKEFSRLVAESSEGAGEQVTARYLMGPDGWNERERGALDEIPVTLIGGDYFSGPGASGVWPNDGLVALSSALAADIGAGVVSETTSLTFPDVHSIYFCHLLGLPWERALTWDADVLSAVIDSIERPQCADG